MMGTIASASLTQAAWALDDMVDEVDEVDEAEQWATFAALEVAFVEDRLSD